MRSPIIWFGGKGMFVKNILKNIPSHNQYIEVFGGGASLLFAKSPCKVETYNDLNKYVVNFFRVIRDKVKFEELHRLCELTPYSRDEFNFCKDTISDEKNDIIKAWKFFTINRMCFSGNMKNQSWSYSVKSHIGNMSKKCFSYLSSVKLLSIIHNRLMCVQIENIDFRKLLKSHNSNTTFAYLDPPYVKITRKSGGYDYEMSDLDHIDLVNILLEYNGKVILSGYENDIYNKLLDNNYICKKIKVKCRCINANNMKNKDNHVRVECLYISPNCFNSKFNLF